MVFIDGIEIYLKPAGASGKDLRIPELELPPDNDFEGRYKQCFVPYLPTAANERRQFIIVVKFPRDFNMYTASAMHIGLGVTKRKYTMESIRMDGVANLSRRKILERAQHKTIAASMIPGSDFCLRGMHGEKFCMSEFWEKSSMADDKCYYWELNTNRFYSDPLNSATITVLLQRGHVTWTDDGMQCREPEAKRILLGTGRYDGPKYKRLSFKRLQSKNGAKIRVEFRPRSHARLVEVENALLSLTGINPLGNAESSDANRYQLLEDKNYRTDLDQAIDILKRKEQEDAEVLNTRQTGTSGPRKQRKRKLPVICDCPDGADCRRRSKTTGQSSRNNLDPESSDRPNTQRRQQSKGSDDRDVAESEAKREDHSEPAKETTAKTCGQCQNVKKPPRGKKIAWREKTGRWMYVSKDAPDEEGPEEDKDDQESPPSAPDKPKALSSVDQDDEEDIFVSRSPQSPNVEEKARSPAPEESDPHDEAVTEDNHPSEDTSTVSLTQNLEDPSMNQANEATSQAPKGPNDAQVLQLHSPPETPDTKKRQQESELEGPASKRTCVEFDLSLDESDDDDVVIMKSERCGNPLAEREGGEDKAGIEKRLRKVQLRREDIQLELEEAELREKLEVMQKKGANGGQVKSEKVVKLEE